MKHDSTVRMVVFGMALLTSTGIAGVLPVLPLLSESLGVSLKMASAVIAAFALPGFFLIPLCGFAADRFGRKAVLVPALAFFLIGGLGAFFARNFEELILFRVLQGCGAAPLGLLYTTIIADTWSGRDRARMMGLTGMALGIGTGISPALGGLLGLFGWRWPFLLSLAALPVLLLGFGVALFKPGKGDDHSEHALFSYSGRLAASLVLPGTLPLLALTFCAFIILSGPVVICFPLIATEYFQAGPLTVGIIMSAASLVSALPASCLSLLYPRFSPRALLLAGQGGYCLALILLPAVAEAALPVAVLLIPLVFYGLAQGLTIPLSASLLSGQAGEGQRASLMALNAMAMKLAQAGGALFFGFLTARGDAAVSCLAGLVPVAFMALLLARAPLPHVRIDDSAASLPHG